MATNIDIQGLLNQTSLSQQDAVNAGLLPASNILNPAELETLMGSIPKYEVPLDIPNFTRLGDRYARKGGFNPLSREQLQTKTQAEIDAYEEQRRRARGSGISDSIRRMGLAFQGIDPNVADLKRQELELRRMQLQQGNFTTDQQNYNLAVQQGYKGTFMDYMKDKKAPLVNIDQGQDDFEKSAAEAGFKRLEKAGEVVEGSSDIDSRLVVLEKQVNNLDPVKTGALEELKIPFKKVAAALNILPQDQLDQLTQQELFQSFSGYIIPRMRVVGSGATSDREIELFKLAVPNIGNTIEGNKLLIGGLRSITQYNKNRLKLMEDYLKENKNLLGFGQYADNNLGPIYKTFTNEGEYVNQVKNGTLKEGDFVFDAVNNQFIILNKADIAAANQ